MINNPNRKAIAEYWNMYIDQLSKPAAAPAT
jgi:hypothetical protein